MAGTPQDIQAGRAFVTLSLDRTGYDKQVADLERSRGGDSGGGSSVAGETAKFVAANAGETVVVAATTGAMRKLGVASKAAAPAIASTGVAATGASVGFGALWAAAAPIVIPLAAIAAAAGLVYLAFFKWDELPLVVKALMLALFPLVIIIRLLVNVFKLLRLAVNFVLAPFRLVTKAVKAFFAVIGAIPGALMALPGQLRRVAVAAGEMAVKVAKSVGKMAARVARSAVEIGKSVAAIPGQIARSTSAALQTVGRSLLRVGSIAAGIKVAIVGGAALAAKSWAQYGEKIRGVRNDLLRFNLTAEEASVIARVAEQTGESMERLARDMRDGTRDFSRWRNEVEQSGNLMSGPQLAAALSLSRAFFSLKSSVLGLKNSIASALGPELEEGAELLTGIVRGVTKWASANKPLIVQVFKVASAIGTAGIAITTLGGVLSGAGAVLSPFVAGMAVLAGVMTAVELRTGAGASLWESYGGSVRRVVGGVLRDLGQMMAFADKVMGGITDAIMVGDLAGAVEIMWAGVKVAWTSALLEIDTLTSGTFGGIINSLISGQWAAAGESAMLALQIAWKTGVGVLSGIWDTVVTDADTAWTGIVTASDNAWPAIVTAADKAWTEILAGLDLLIDKMKSALSEFLEWAANEILPLVQQVNEVGVAAAGGTGKAAVGGAAALLGPLTGPLGIIAEAGAKAGIDAAAGALTDANAAGIDAAIQILDARKERIGSINEPAKDEPVADRAAALATREAARQATSDEARVAREEEIAALKLKQKESAEQGGEAAKAQLTKHQKDLADAIKEQEEAVKEAEENKLKAGDFAVSEATQSIARFSGEALGLSVGRSNDPAEKVAKLTEKQLKEIEEHRKEARFAAAALQRLLEKFGFQ